MAEQFIQLPADSTGKKVRTFEQTVGANVVEHQAFVLCDSSGNIIGSLAAQAAGTEQGLVTRPASTSPDAVAGPTNITAASGFGASIFGTFLANSPAANSSVAVACNGAGTLSINVTGTWVGTLQFEATVDGTNWIQINAVPAASSALATSTTQSGLWQVDCGGFAQVRVRCSAYTSGTAVVTLRAWASSVPGQVAIAGAAPSGAEAAVRLNGQGYLIPPVQWAQAALPAAGAVASTVRGAGAGVTHVCTGITASITNNGTPAAAAPQLVLRDGASGVGGVLWSVIMGITSVASNSQIINLTGLNIAGTAGNAMTLEFTAGSGNTFEVVSLSGYDL